MTQVMRGVRPISSPGLFVILLAASTGVGAAETSRTYAHQTEASAVSERIAEHNILGLIQYCRTLGLVDDGAVAAQRRVVDALSGSKDVGEAEETEGRRGVIATVRAQVPLAQSAQAQGMTMETKCEQMALSLPH